MTRSKFGLLGATSLSVVLAMPTLAQTSGSELVEEIVVRGQFLFRDQVNALRTPTPIIDVPQSLSIVTAEQITQQGFTSVGDIINYTPGVNTSQGEGHRDAVVFRGVRSTADFFIDGARDDVQYYRPLYNLEQVAPVFQLKDNRIASKPGDGIFTSRGQDRFCLLTSVPDIVFDDVVGNGKNYY